MSEKIGAFMIEKPELIADMVTQTKKLIDLSLIDVNKPYNVIENQNNYNFHISIKIRIHENIRKTVDLIKQAQKAGVDWVTVHGRTLNERTKVPVHLDAVKTVCCFFLFFAISQFF